MNQSYTIEDVFIELTYPDDSQDTLLLEAPNGDDAFQFGFLKVPVLEDYKDATNTWQPGYNIYQFISSYRYASHNMDLRRLLVAKNIRLYFPPQYGGVYQGVDVLLSNDSVIRNWLAGLVTTDGDGDNVPLGEITLEFEGVQPFKHSEVMNAIQWAMQSSAEPVPPDDFVFLLDESTDSYITHNDALIIIPESDL